jgi:hydrogenase maturation protein HypF
VVLSVGVFQNELLLRELTLCPEAVPLRLWANSEVPPNDGGISLGQAALALRVQ